MGQPQRAVARARSCAPLAQRAQDIADDDITDANARDPDEA
jgi:hypothetical protein